MLGPFRVSGQDSPARPGSPTQLRRLKSINAVVSIDGDRYEQMIRSVPGARLQYHDVDQDIITIGSKQELADRLAETVPHPPAIRNITNHLHPLVELHSFMLRPGSRAVQEWKQVEDEQIQKLSETETKNMEEAAHHSVQRDNAPERPPKIPESPQPAPSSSKGKAPEAREPPQFKAFMEQLADVNNALVNRQAAQFRHSDPPTVSVTGGESSKAQAAPAKVTEPMDRQSDSHSVLTPQGMEQAREEGAKLRARLAEVSVGTPFYSSNTSRPDNRWASYSKPSVASEASKVQPLLPGRPGDLAQALLTLWRSDPDALLPKGQSVSPQAAIDGAVAHARPVENEGQPSTVPTVKLMKSDRPKEASSVVGTSSQTATSEAPALAPSYWESMHSRLASLAGNADETSAKAKDTQQAPVKALTSDQSVKQDQNESKPRPSCLRNNQANVPSVDLREPLEIMVGKMVAQSVESISSELASLGGRLQELILPKLPEEAFKLKGYPDPEQLKEMWRDLEETRRALQTFGLRVNSAARVVSETEGSGMFPAGSGMVDLGAIRAYSTALKEMTEAVNDLVENVLKDAVPVEGSEASKKHPSAEYVIPKRLTACNYEDMWSIALGNLDRDASADHVRYLVWRARSSVGLPTNTCRIGEVQIVRYVSGCQAEVEISGKQQAGETFNALLTAESDPSYPQPLHLKRKLYPKVHRLSEQEHGTTQLPQHGSSDTRNQPDSSLDQSAAEAKLKSIQDRRAAWRREYKARASNVRFKEPVAEPAERKDSGALLDSPVPSLRTAPSLKPSPIEPRINYLPHSNTSNQISSFPSALAAQLSQPRPSLRPANSMASIPKNSLLQKPDLKQKRSLPTIRPSVPANVAPALGPARSMRTQDRVSHGHARQVKILDPKHNVQPVRKEYFDPFQVFPGAWPDEKALAESSGAFSRRMMGLSPAVSHLISPQTSPTLRSVKPMRPRPVSAIDFLAASGPAATAAVSGPRIPNSDLQRRATVADPSTKSAGGPWSRRPYSMNFDGSGRATERPTWEAHFGLPAQPVEGSEEAATKASVSIEKENAERRLAQAEDKQAQECMNSLVELGYGSRDDKGEINRLWMFARMAKGDLEEAIDLIEEEREAWRAGGMGC